MRLAKTSVAANALLLSAVLLAGAAAQAQSPLTANTLQLDDPAAPGAATIADAEFLTGTWVGEGLGGISEEGWSAPRAGSMVGYFRLVKNDAVAFYEIFALVEEGGSLVLKLKHFNADLTGWEEKDKMVTFHLIKHTPNELNFRGLTFRRVDENTLHIFLAFRQKDGTYREETFRLRRTDR